ncbi:hypothetical protein OXB_2399 [Bacillus sp. OxB-1]|uniref:hypothetical protein n=1 Tax=Bacillus sp. (strain OxB-1) TaxID=98228 RepID=UPI000581C868|nr:hypothetical protein [Bacillus sp. OxB-1]BAQ10870.1 hypothetical protein OXB_2399 [Bacillus sp. OxB-1]
MKIVTGILFLLCLGYFYYRFFRLLIKMKQSAVFPKTEEDWRTIRKQPQKAVDLPGISHQKTGFFMNGLTLLFLTIFVIGNLFSSNTNWPAYLVFIPIFFNLSQVWNLFAIVKDGILSGGRFVPWKSIRSYHFVPIDTNHRFYGYSPEVNGGYELKIQTKRSAVSCIVTSETGREKVAEVLDAHLDS